MISAASPRPVRCGPPPSATHRSRRRTAWSGRISGTASPVRAPCGVSSGERGYAPRKRCTSADGRALWSSWRPQPPAALVADGEQQRQRENQQEHPSGIPNVLLLVSHNSPAGILARAVELPPALPLGGGDPLPPCGRHAP